MQNYGLPSIEQMTTKLEKEQRISMLLDDQIRALKEDLKEVKSKERLYNDRHKKLQKIQIIERRLQIATNSLNSAQSDTKQLRDLVELQRNDKLNKISTCTYFNRNIRDCQDDTVVNFRAGATDSSLDSIQKQNIMKLKARSIAVRSSYNVKFTQLNSVLQEDDNERVKAQRTLETSLGVQYVKSPDVIVAIRTLKNMIKASKQRLIDKKRDVENYVRYIKQIQDCFRQIILATGIAEIDEIVTSIIKTQEQQYDVWQYLNILSAEIESLEDTNKKTLDSIQSAKNSTYTGKEKAYIVIQSMINQIKDKRNLGEATKKHVQDTRSEFKAVKKSINRISTLFHFFNIRIDIGEDWEVSETGLQNIIANLETAISKLLDTIHKLNLSNLIESPKFRESKSQNFREILKQELLSAKDLIQDPEFDDSKVPFKLEYLRSKAVQYIDSVENKTFDLSSKEESVTKSRPLSRMTYSRSVGRRKDPRSRHLTPASSKHL